ncbi:hypothetical protein KFZ56_18855 [Virgibacillus sp. NKC19-3]|uniref:spr1630 family ClpXP-sensitive toxin n=1 Tax=Virgibacillus saliphilus TaxID=2831674 RepID=UPI001C9A7F25|nr:hypothetical protein [Virgibacillus sp. NKC19-3]MBY7145081.1 hypothetical protein [Virgibacillus sp. NKC19-3]
MEQYKFDAEHSKEIVNAIVEGYRNYVEHRKDRHEKMKISSAFAWTKGNFIESQIADISSDLHLLYKKAKAGLTWDYLQFIHDDTKKIFLIKNATYFNENNFSQAVLPNKDINQRVRRTYLHELSKINQNLDFPAAHSNQESRIEYSEQLSFFITEKQVKDELDQFKSSYNEFHILTYEIDAAYQISKIAHYLPNPDDNIAYMVEDLSKYISGAALSDDEREIVAPKPDDDLIDPREYDIGIFEDEENK